MLDEAATRYIKSKQKEAALEAINDANINFIIQGQGLLQNQNDSQDSFEVKENENQVAEKWIKEMKVFSVKRFNQRIPEYEQNLRQYF